MTKFRTQKNTIFLTILALLLGLGIMTTVNTNWVEEAAEDTENQELIAYIEQTEAETAVLAEKIKATREEIDSIQNAQSEGETLLTSLKSTLSILNQQAGLTALSGPGILITLDDNRVGAELAQKNNPATYNAENYIVHDKDLLYLVRTLSTAMEALSINDIRIVDTSSIRCTGSVIMVNSTRLAPPYEIKVIGDPDALQEALYASSRYHRLVYIEIPISVTTVDELTIPSYSGVYSTTYSSPLNQE